MAGFEMEMPQSIDTGGAFLQASDLHNDRETFHLAVMEVDEQPTAKDGKLLDGFRVEVELLAGPHAKKQAELMFFAPKLTDKNGGEMAKKKQARFVLATGVLSEAKAGEKVTVDLQKAKARQFIATLAKRDSQSDPNKKFIDLNFADIWHVDDPAAPQCERNQQALGLIPKTLRKSPESFSKPDAKAKSSSGTGAGNTGNGSATGGQGQQQKELQTIGKSDVGSLDDLLS